VTVNCTIPTGTASVAVQVAVQFTDVVTVGGGGSGGGTGVLDGPGVGVGAGVGVGVALATSAVAEIVADCVPAPMYAARRVDDVPRPGILIEIVTFWVPACTGDMVVRPGAKAAPCPLPPQLARTAATTTVDKAAIV
jgi:hypothetical protein